MRMNFTDFKALSKEYINKAQEFEIESLFKHFTQGPKDFITLQDFKDGFG